MVDWSNDKEAEAALDLVRRRMRESPRFRQKAINIINRYRAEQADQEKTSSLDYLDSTLKSPRLRAVLEEAKQQDRDQRKEANAR